MSANRSMVSPTGWAKSISQIMHSYSLNSLKENQYPRTQSTSSAMGITTEATSQTGSLTGSV